MAEARVLRERKKIINYNEDAEQVPAQRKIVELIGERRDTRSCGRAGGTDKENWRKRGRHDSASLSVSESGSDSENERGDVPSRPPTKRLASQKEDEGSEPIEDSSGGANAFIAFARPGRRPAPRQPGKPQARPTRAAATRASRRISNAATANDSSEEEEEEDGDYAAPGECTRRGGQPSRTAAATIKERPRRSAAAGSTGRGSNKVESEESENDEEELEDGDVMIVSESSSDGDEEMEEVKPTAGGKPSASRAAARGKKPAQTCTRSAAAVANASKGGARQRAAQGHSDIESSESYDEEEDKDDEDFKGTVMVSRRETAGRSSGRRQPSRAKAASSDGDEEEDEDDSDGEDEEEEGEEGGSEGEAGPVTRRQARGSGGSADSEDSEVQLVDDSEDGGGGDASDCSDDEGLDDEVEEPVRRGPGRPRKDGGKAGDGKAGRVRPGRGAKGGAQKRGKAAAAKGAKDRATTTAYKGPVERILSYDAEKDKYLVKLEGVSYRHTSYVTQPYLEKAKANLLRMFNSREETVEVDPEWQQVDRVIAARTVTRGRQGKSRQLLVKWRGLEYSDSTWENEDDLDLPVDKAAIARFELFDAPPRKKQSAGNPLALRQAGFELPTFCNGRALRDYQQVSVRWMVNNYSQRRNCILGDEMGLGKTAQSTSCLETLRTVGGIPGPFLVVAPLSTLGHWQREIQTWTDMNVVLLSGSIADRAVILEHEFYRSGSSSGSGTGGGRNGSRCREVKFNVLLVSYNTLLKERALLRSVSWAAAVFDEAHRLKGLNSSTRAAVEELDIDWLLLLTGTPIQNNMIELFSILSLLDPEAYPSVEDFTTRFGGAPGGPPPTVEQIRALQAALAPILLRRMKEDVEELPQKEEVVVWVELTAHQRAYYRALYEGQIGALLGGMSSKNLPSMRNLAMELRKLCCHPVLCDGLEEDLKRKLEQQRSQAPPGAPLEFQCREVELLVRGSGKMVLLHKLLHKLRAEGRRVLIFSQFVIMLNVLEDYCTAVGFPVERIDGNVQGRDRQRAIDRFCAGGEGSEGAFVFLLSTRAGGQGITLTAADTCIIYDSDWNPQNDLQAMARCHRIGQKKEVTVYRLISRDTYEMALFNCASRKYGLDEAILGFSGGSDPESDSARIAELLRHGAHGLLADMEAGLRQGEAFASEDINQILAARTEKRQIGSRAGNTFSVATFAADDGGGVGGDGVGSLGGLRGARRGGLRAKRRGAGDGEADGEDAPDKDYWRTLMPDAVAAHEARVAEGPVTLGPRKRRQINYNMDDKKYDQLDSDDSSDDLDSSREEGQQGGEAEGREGGGGEGGDPSDKKQRERRRKQLARPAEAAVEGQEAGQEAGQEGAPIAGGKSRGRKASKGGWTKPELKALEERLVALGPNRWDEVYEQLQPFKYSAADVEAAGRAMWALYDIAAALAAERKAEKKKAEAEARAAAMCSTLDDDDMGGPSTAPKVAEAGPSAAGSNPAGANGAGTGADVVASAATAAKNPDEYEEKLAKDIPDKVPEFLHTALSAMPTLRRLLREAAENLRHGKNMQELVQIMRPKQQQPHGQQQEGQPMAATAAAAGGGSAGHAPIGVNGLRACYMPPPATVGGYLNWWNRADDEALLMAVVEAGYVPGKPARTIEHALRNQPLAGRVVQKPEPEQEQQQEQQGQTKDGSSTAAGDKGIASAGAGACALEKTPAPAPATVKPSGTTACDQEVAAAAGEPKPTSPAAPVPHSPGPIWPVQLSSAEWRPMVAILSRRLNKIVTATLELHRRLAASAKKPQLTVVKPAQPSGTPPHLLPVAAAAGAGASASRPQSGTGTAAGLAVVQAAAVAKLVVATAAAAAVAARRASNANENAPPIGGAVHPVVAAGASLSGQQPQQQGHHHHQCQQRAADPPRRVSLETPSKQQSQQQGRPPGAEAVAAAMPTVTTVAGLSNKPGALKQRTLPFTRLRRTGTQSKAAAGDGGGSTHGDVKAATAGVSPPKGDALAAPASDKIAAAVPGAVPARVQPGSAEKPIVIDESD